LAVSVHHQRIEAVFAGQRPDRVPICEQAFASSVASEILGREAHTGGTELHYRESLAWLRGDAAHEDFVEQIYQDVLELHRTLDLDILFLPWRFGAKPTRQLGEYRFLYGDPEGNSWSVYQYDPISHTFGLADAACLYQTFEEVEPVLRSAVGADPGQPALPDFAVRALREVGDEWPVAGGCFMAIPMKAGFMEAVAIDPGLVAAYVDLQVERGLRLLEVEHAAGIRLINGGGDFAFNAGPAYSPTFFFEVMAPRWKRFFDRCRELGMWYVMRSDGNLWPVADGLFGPGLAHAYYECDFDAGMRFADLRAAYPELVLMGNVSCGLLATGTPDQVRAATEACLRAAYPRIIAASANAILAGTPAENVLALYGTAKRWGRGV
jgi:hypothetical protein